MAVNGTNFTITKISSVKSHQQLIAQLLELELIALIWFGVILNDSEKTVTICQRKNVLYSQTHWIVSRLHGQGPTTLEMVSVVIMFR